MEKVQRIVTEETQRLEKMTYCAGVRVCPSFAMPRDKDSPKILPAEPAPEPPELMNMPLTQQPDAVT